jgi:hypothetical protein
MTDASQPIGHASHAQVIIHGVEADRQPCEVCGEHLTRLQVKQVELPDGTTDHAPDGPWFEGRQHWIGNVRHHWWQEHNCIKQPPDACPFCEQAPPLGPIPHVPRDIPPPAWP